MPFLIAQPFRAEFNVNPLNKKAKYRCVCLNQHDFSFLFDFKSKIYKKIRA